MHSPVIFDGLERVVDAQRLRSASAARCRGPRCEVDGALGGL